MGNVSSLKPHGHFWITDPYGGMREGETLSCVHCGKHWPIERGSGKTKGFCMRCNGYTCGPGCDNCVPTEKMLDILDGIRNPTAVSVPVLWTPPGSA